MPGTTLLRSGFRFGTSDLPYEFAHPPLIEAWLGVEFDCPTDFMNVEATEWRQRLGPEWPVSCQSVGPAEHHAPRMQAIERQLCNVMSDRAIRIASNRFSFGWLGHDGNMYPRYEAIRDGFVATLDAVRDVVPQLGLPVRSRVSYLNRIPQGTVWNTPEDWSFFRLWQPNPLQKLKIEPNGFAGLWLFPLEAERGALTIELTHEPSTESSQQTQALWLRITSSGPTDADEASLFDGLDFGREMVVRAFSDLVSSDAKDFWGVAPRKKTGP